MSEVKVNKISPRSGTDVTLGDSGDTFTIPAGATITNNGTAVNFGATGSASWVTSSIKTATFTATAGEGYFCDTSAGVFTVNLPAGTAGDVVAVKDYANSFDTYNLTISANGSEKIGGDTADVNLSSEGTAVTLVYVDSTKGWLVTDSGLQSDAPQTYTIDFLVIAGGGGGGGKYYAGGGGAGGYRTSSQGVGAGVVITTTVGDGGALGTASPSNRGGDGVDSQISGTGLTTITSAGGGGGGADSAKKTGNNGGSGGAGSGYSSSASDAGSGNTPSTTPSQGNDGGSNTVGGVYGGGGGGGAGQIGNNSTSDNGAAGGTGTASSITGASVTRAGGGGGSGSNNGGAGGTLGAGGTGGGGDGGRESPSVSAQSGTANTGGGGGGGAAADGAAGGKGVIILSMPDGNYSGNTTGSPTVTTGVSGKTIIEFNGTGSYTT